MNAKCSLPRSATAVEIDRLFLGERLSARRFRRLWRHLADCEACRAYYDRASLVWREMGIASDPPQVIEALAEQLAHEVAGAASSEAHGVLGRLRAWLARPAVRAGLTLATGALGVVTLVSLRGIHRTAVVADQGAWTERGASPGRLRGVRAFCLGSTPGSAMTVLGSAPSGHAPAIPVLQCPASGSIQFAYTLGAGGPEYLLIVGQDAAGGVTQIEPRVTDGAASLALRAGSSDEPLSHTLPLGAAPGRSPIPSPIIARAFFSSAPLSLASLQSTLDAPGSSRAGHLVTDEQSVRIEVAP